MSSVNTRSRKRAAERAEEKPAERIGAFIRKGLPPSVVVAALAAVAKYLMSHRRETAIATSFLRNDAGAQIALAAFLLTVGVLLAIRFRKPVSSGRLALSLGSRRFAGGAPLVVLGVVAFALLVAVLNVRYAVFSQTCLQSHAIAEARAGKMADSTRTCSRYLQLYPQRRPGRMLADPICVDILGDFGNVRRLAEYIRQSPIPDVSRPLRGTTFAFSTRTEAIHLLEWTWGVTPQSWWTPPPDSTHGGSSRHPPTDWQ
jgi:hypothetical protein